ncbi:Histone acetyltransferase type B catalytic subunit [Armadillidium vulgare]|nr:Histone acetyltransferase type B catalytic subunit [Armadillidium vulgare]
MLHRFTLKTGFLEYHERLQTFLLLFIDASSYIDTDDERWRYEKYMVNGNPHYAVAGYSTVYEYYAYPCNMRPRISQMLILPPFQRIGVGAGLLQTIYQHYKVNPKVIDITVEDPSESFQRLRDYVDARNCQELKDISFSDLPELTFEVLETVQKDLKLCKRQIRRVYEILKLQKINRQDEKEYREYRLFVKNRLNAPFRREDSDMKKLKKVLSPEELAAALSITSREQRLETLENLYKNLEEEYNIVIEKLNGK